MFGLFGGGNLKDITRKALERSREANNEASENLDMSQEAYKNAISKVGNLAGAAYGEGDKSVLERYGDTVDQITNQVQGGAASTKRTIGRTMMAGGGDISGAGAVQMSNADQRANEAIGSAITKFTAMNDRQNNVANSRGDRLVGMELNANARKNSLDQNLYGMTNQMLTNAEGQEIDRVMANRQLALDIASTAVENINPIKKLF